MEEFKADVHFLKPTTALLPAGLNAAVEVTVHVNEHNEHVTANEQNDDSEDGDSDDQAGVHVWRRSDRYSKKEREMSDDSESERGADASHEATGGSQSKARACNNAPAARASDDSDSDDSDSDDSDSDDNGSDDDDSEDSKSAEKSKKNEAYKYFLKKQKGGESVS